MTDNVNHPAHYTAGGVECIDALTAATKGLEGLEAVCTANAIKYLWRWKRKNGTEDLKKARWYIERLIAVLETPEAPEEKTETCRERLAREHPDLVSGKYIGGCMECPHYYGYASELTVEECEATSCSACWDRPVEAPKEKAETRRVRLTSEHPGVVGAYMGGRPVEVDR